MVVYEDYDAAKLLLAHGIEEVETACPICNSPITLYLTTFGKRSNARRSITLTCGDCGYFFPYTLEAIISDGKISYKIE